MDSRRMCPHCRAFITIRDRVCPYCNEAVAPRAAREDSPSGFIGGFIPHARFNTVIILLINFGLYIATAIFSMNSGRGDAMSLDSRTLVDFGAKYTPLIWMGQWWRLVTAGFLHGGLLHIVMNSWVLFDLGASVEELYGGSRMLVIYFLSNVGGFYLSSLLSPATPSVGASAALFGLIGAMIAVGIRHRSALGDAVKSLYIRWAIYGLLFGLLPGVDNAAHVGGLTAGFLVAYAAGQPRSATNSPIERLWQAASWLCILITLFCFLKMYLWMSQSAQ